MDNFRTTKAFDVKGFKNISTKIDKGHNAQFEAYINSIKKGGEPLIKFQDIVNVTQASFAAIESLKTGQWVKIN